MTAKEYFNFKQALVDEGYADEIAWQTDLQPATDPIVFRDEAVWVILNSGMKEQIARIIHKRIWDTVKAGGDISTAFKHEGKVKAIKIILNNYEQLFKDYSNCPDSDKIQFLQCIPFIGPITCFHLAKNLGLDCVKPDRHLVRIAKKYGVGADPAGYCKYLSGLTGDKVSVVDIVLWRAANLGLL